MYFILKKDQLKEIRNKWNQIDDEIWAKIICFERNRRVAKAYARSQVISINGSDRGFDGYRIGLNGFPNPKRDLEVQMIKQQIRSGFKLKIDDLGNVHIKRIGRCPVFLGPGIPNRNSDSHYSQQQQQQQQRSRMIPLEINKPQMIFDFKKFQQSMVSILSQPPQQTPLKNSRQRMNPLLNAPTSSSSSSLENYCVHHIQLMVDNEQRHQYLRHPCWILLINIVALDLFWSKFKSNDALNPVISRKLFTSNLANNLHRRVPLKAKNPLYDPCEDDYYENNVSHEVHCSDHCFNRRGKISDDLYYCGYAAKISNTLMSNHQSSSSSTTMAKLSASSIPVQSKYSISSKRNGSLEKKKLSASATPITTTPIKTKSRYIQLRPNPMKQLPTFNRIGLEQSKRLFFSSHQLSNGQIDEHPIKQSDDDIKHISSLKQYLASNRSNSKYSSSSSSTSSSSTTSYSPHYQRFNYNQNRQHHNLNNRYSTPSKLNYRMKQTYRSTCDLLS
ncbi:hypothetical protein DERP_009585 [Dermatophagoides pteronyssinus]|uniref:MH2 domain-containing protein n=1 Tax=Dermatophagoides pteronyssinus TaxID=6956 RepID=A0ABQ8JAA0_DERPT|nr:hypothetical protein DERP_009585 [Dermatophagoides pteronyssinus]